MTNETKGKRYYLLGMVPGGRIKIYSCLFLDLGRQKPIFQHHHILIKATYEVIEIRKIHSIFYIFIANTDQTFLVQFQRGIK
uniref:Uncharacterized protein n=1 Tax=Octopus bimaculoides TaxID=37653 RepID=A0A0L8IGX4_OCTBM